MQYMKRLAGLEPQNVWTFFDQITQVPRPSKKEEKIRRYLKDFAAENNLEVREDKAGNVVIVKNATPGYEDKPAIILQSHMDMVCEKEPGVEFDFDNDPIDVYVEDGWVKARGTTLGADCGIGMALAMAVLADSGLKHPKIEALFTVDEEQGLNGAVNLGEGMLEGKKMINLDSEDEGEIFIGCAGGIDTLATFKYKPRQAPADSEYYKISVSGLHGGHSGGDIDKGFANANKLLARVLRDFMKISDVYLAYMDGGNLRNAIPRDAVAIIAVSEGKRQELLGRFEKMSKDIAAEYAHTEPGFQMSFDPADVPESVMGLEETRRLIAAVCAAPNGVIEMSRVMENLVETSTNLASVKFKPEGVVIVSTSQRSAVESAKNSIAADLENLFWLAGAEVTHSEGYPGWTPDPASPFVVSSVEVYKKLFNELPKIKAIHAGLECGLFLKKYPHLEIISIGPTLKGVHSPSEKLEISTVSKLWQFLCALIADK